MTTYEEWRDPHTGEILYRRIEGPSEYHDPGDEDRRPDLYCRNCGDPFGPDAEAAALCVVQHCPPGAHGSWRPCPNPSPGRPLVDCGVGGHMYTDSEPRID